MTIRINCERYPCHFPEQDCTFCFCPFYPCMDSRTGGRLESEWTCEACTIVHRQDVSEMMIQGIMRGDELDVIRKRLDKRLDEILEERL